jgi:hypothetical protein
MAICIMSEILVGTTTIWITTYSKLVYKRKVNTSGITKSVKEEYDSYNFQKLSCKVILFMLQKVMHMVITELQIFNNDMRAENSLVFM